MKTKFITVLFLLTSFFIGCKDDKSSQALEAVGKEVSKNFTVTLNVNVKKNDNFCLFYTEDGSTDFTKNQPVWIDVKGSDNAQDVTFKLPEDVLPTQIRLDFGISQEQSTILINKFSMSYLDKSFEAPGDKFYYYFDADKSKTIFDKDKKTIDAVLKDGKRESPSFYPNTKPLGEEISKLIK